MAKDVLMKQHLLFQYGLAQIEHRQRQSQEDDGAEGPEPVAALATGEQVELVQAMPDQAGDDEKQCHAEQHIDQLEPGGEPAALLVPHQPGDQPLQVEGDEAPFPLQLKVQLALGGGVGGQYGDGSLLAGRGQYEGVACQRLVRVLEQTEHQQVQLGLVLLIAANEVDGAHIGHGYLQRIAEKQCLAPRLQVTGPY